VPLLKLQRTIHAQLVLDRKEKRETVEREYNAWQRQLKGSDEQLYSATRQQAERLRQRIRKQNGYGLKQQEYPLILRRDCVAVQKQPESFYKWWFKISLYPKSIWVPIHFPHEQEPLLRYDLRECKLIRHGENWFTNVTIQKKARLKRKYATILPIDMGIRKLATTIENGRPRFYGKEIRQTRGNYFRLRRSVGKSRIIKKWRHRERKAVRHQVHRITRQIVNKAKQMNAIIAIGDLRGIREQDKSRSFNRRLASQPFHLFKQYLTYKANWEGIRVIEVPEAYISQTCHECGVRGQRVVGRFSCPNCGLEIDADVNGAWNIAKRTHGFLHETGAALTLPITLGGWEP
jgi:putative transposase